MHCSEARNLTGNVHRESTSRSGSQCGSRQDDAVRSGSSRDDSTAAASGEAIRTGYHEADRECIGKSYPAQSNRPIRIGDAEDGSFYVVYQLGGNIRIDKFNACTTSASQLTRASSSFPMTVSGYSSFVGCEVKNGG